MIKKSTKKDNKIPKTFLVSIVFALLFWSLTKLSREYKTVVSFPVSYINLPQDKLIQETPVAAIDMQVTGTGFRLFTSSFKNNKINLDARNLIKKRGSQYYFLLKNQEVLIQQQLSENYKIESIIQDTIYLDLGLLISKKVPIAANLDLQYKLGYHLVDNIQLTPDSMLVFGPEAQINKLTSLQLVPKKLSDISENINEILDIETPINFEQVNFSESKVVVTGIVDRFTEGTIEVPFEVVNLPSTVTINTFPKTIDVVYQVGLSNFSKIDVNSFKIECDFTHSELNNLPYLVPKIISKSSFVNSVKLIPNKVDFLIVK